MDALAEHIPLLRQVQDGTLSVPVAAVQQAVCARLQLYTTETATTLIVRTLICWGEDREQGLRANPEYRQWPIYCGSSGIAVVDKRVIPHQEDRNESPPFSGQINHESLFAHGFVMR